MPLAKSSSRIAFLDKHPAPWIRGTGGIHPEEAVAIFCPASDSDVLSMATEDEDATLMFEDEAVERLILAAPELLAALKESVNDAALGIVDEGRMLRWSDLIARIEGRNAD
jgi:hypothetical protein